MQWRLRMSGLGCAVAALAFVGCATQGYDTGRLQSELVRAGTTAEQARCITDGLSGTFDETQLGTHSEPTTEEMVTARAILRRCKIKVPLQPLP